jgi:cytochrome c-type protein NapB
MKKLILMINLIFAVLVVGCNSGGDDNSAENKKADGTAFRKGDLFSENFDLGEMATVKTNVPGLSQKVDRAFENAPPLISHQMQGFDLITLDVNTCLTCHMPDKAVAAKATPMPATHFKAFRPEIKLINGKYVLYEKGNQVEIRDLKGKMDMGRYNCTQCHVPQTNAELDVKNTFQAVFRDTTNKHKSNLIEKFDEGVQ